MEESNNQIYVLGKTTTREAYVITQGKPFVQSEYLVIVDKLHGNIIGEVVETNNYPMIVNSILPTGCVIEFIKKLGFDTDEITSIGKVKILEELQYPITPSSVVRKPEFDEVKHLLINTEINKGLLLGVVKGTEEVQKSLPDELKDIVPLWVDKKIVPQKEVPFTFNYRKLREYPGMGLFGGSGSGKTVALRSICEELMEVQVPGLVFDLHYELDFKEPNEGLDSSMVRDYSNKYEVFHVGKNLGIRFETLSSSELIDLMEFSAELSPPMRSALEAVYEKGDTLSYLRDKIKKLKIAFDNEAKPKHQRSEISQDAVILYEKYKHEVSGSATLQGLSWRLYDLDKSGIFRGDTALVEKAIRNCKLAVLRSQKETALQMISAYLIKKMYKLRRNYQDFQKSIDENEARPDFFPMFFVILDEAHNFASNAPFTTPNKRILRELAQEARKYGVFEAFATQRPHLLDTTILAQLNTKFIFRMNNENDMNAIKVESNLTDQEFSRLPDLVSGNCFVSSATLRKNYFVKFRTSRTKSPHQFDPFDELELYKQKIARTSLSVVLINFLPIKSDKIQNIHADINRAYGSHVTVEEIKSELEKMANSGDVSRKKSALGCMFEAI